MNNILKITIITPVYNGEKYLKETIESVLNQSYGNIEYIIVDGQSTDNTINIINEYQSNINNVIIQADKSMYEAINRGVETASGDYILILNSDDCLVEKHTIQQVVEFIERDPGSLAYYGNIFLRKDTHVSKRRVFQIGHKHLLYTEHCTLIPHPALFVKRSASLHLVGLYDLSYKYASDFDYILRLLKKGMVTHMNIYITIFRIHTASITSSGNIDHERLKIIRYYTENKPKYLKLFYYYLIWLKYKIMNILINIG